MEALILAAAAAFLLWIISKAQKPQAKAEAPPQKPTATARDRLAREMADLQSQLAAPRPTRRDIVRQVRGALERDWVANALARVPIESVDVEGVGPKVIEALGRAGVRTLADLDLARLLAVDGVGQARADALISYQRTEATRVKNDFAAADDDLIDRWSGGRLIEAKLEAEAAVLTAERQISAIEARIADLTTRATEAGFGNLKDTIAAQVSTSGLRAAPPARTASSPTSTANFAAKAMGFLPQHEASQAKLDQQPGRRQAASVGQGAYRCPRCGGTLRKRSGRYGSFYGCSRYPSCRYTRSG